MTDMRALSRIHSKICAQSSRIESYVYAKARARRCGRHFVHCTRVGKQERIEFDAAVFGRRRTEVSERDDAGPKHTACPRRRLEPPGPRVTPAAAGPPDFFGRRQSSAVRSDL